MKNNQVTSGGNSPIINGDKNKISGYNSKTKITFKKCAGFTFLGFVFGVATSFVGSYLYDEYSQKQELSKKVEIENPVDSLYQE